MASSTLDPDNIPEPDRQLSKGHGTRALGPSDTSDSGSDVQGGLRWADEADPGLDKREPTKIPTPQRATRLQGLTSAMRAWTAIPMPSVPENTPAPDAMRTSREQTSTSIAWITSTPTKILISKSRNILKAAGIASAARNSRRHGVEGLFLGGVQEVGNENLLHLVGLELGVDILPYLFLEGLHAGSGCQALRLRCLQCF